MKKMILYSGGIDSTVCLALAVRDYGIENVCAISINYGQKNDYELSRARLICEYYNVENKVIDLSNIFLYNKNCSMIKGNKEIPKISYDEQVKIDCKTSTNVPFRNGLMLSICVALAIDNDFDQIYYGIHLEDGVAASLYPDCSEKFHIAMNDTIKIATDNEISLYAPLVNMKKEEIIKLGYELNIPFELTWTCYENSDVACGKCTACVDRINGFKKCGLIDPIMYRGRK